MLKKEEDGVTWLEFELLTNFKRLRHGVFLRHGGYSLGNFNSLNFSITSGDSKEHVKANFDKLKKIFNIEKIVLPHMVHGNLVREVDNISYVNKFQCDALTTTEIDLGLMMTHADCQATIFYDPVQEVIANVHAGWRGSVQNIYGETIEFMKKCYGTSPKNLLVCISPSLGPDDAEFIHYKEELPQHFWQFQTKPHYFDFWAISQQQLIDGGILPHHIEIAKISTFSNTEDFFSYRKEKPTGRNATLVFLKH